MTEFARWQWDDVGQWRDFAEQYQAEMEACFQERRKSVEISIPPHGTFRMDVERMQQVTLKGRNPGYHRDIRRQARKIEAGYFILGEEGDIFASNEAIEQIEDIPVLQALAKLIGRIVAEPEEFGHRSANVQDDEWSGTLGETEEAVEFLKERGFEEIEEGKARFLVFMQEDILGLKEALQEVEARMQRVAKRRSSSSVDAAAESNAVEEDESNAVVELSDVQLQDAKNEDNNANNDVEMGESNQVFEASPCSEADSGAHGAPSDAAGSSETRPRIESVGPEHDGAAIAAGRLAVAMTGTLSEPPFPLPSRPLSVVLVLPSKNEETVDLAANTLDELVKAAVKSSGLRMPLVQAAEDDQPLGLASEPNVLLSGKALHLQRGAKVCVQDFEHTFVEKLSSGLLRLQDLASVAPVLAWERPELTKLLHGRLKALLEGSADAWCKAAACSSEGELLFGRALLRRLYSERPLEERMEICRKLLPTEKREEKTVVKVDRENYLCSALGALEKLSVAQLRKHFAVDFKGETAEDYGGPRRDFFGNFGSRLASEMPKMWKRLPKGALVPVADLVAEKSPKADRAGIQDVQGAYRACGRACGLALKHGDVIGEEIARFFLYQVARDDTVSLEELQEQLSESDGSDDIRCGKDIMSSDLASLGLVGQTLSRAVTDAGIEVDLVPGGRNIEVTDDNKIEWLELHLHDKLYGRLRKAADAFRDGLLDVLGGTRRSCPFLVLLSPAEMASAWAGSAVGDEQLKRWKDVTTVSEEVQEQGDWLWDILQEMDEGMRGKVLKFATGMHRISEVGLQTFELQPANGGDESLPRAMTCANMLQLPKYTSQDVLKSQLLKATELCDGFQVL